MVRCVFTSLPAHNALRLPRNLRVEVNAKLKQRTLGCFSLKRRGAADATLWFSVSIFTTTSGNTCKEMYRT